MLKRQWERLLRLAKLLWRLYGRYKRSLILLTVLGFAGGVLESFGVTMLIPLLSHVLQESLPEVGSLSRYFNTLFRFFGFGMRSEEHTSTPVTVKSRMPSSA